LICCIGVNLRAFLKETIMSSNYKPQNYNSVSPYLIVNGAAETIQFLIDAFDAEELRRFPNESGRLMHAEVRLDDTVLMLADAVEEWPAIPAHVHIYVSDVDTTYQRALAAGATSVQEPVKKEDDDRRGGVKDAGGITWWIATRVV
jgi:PhnB protein